MTHPLRILLIDDNPSDRALVVRELQREFDSLQIQEIASSGQLNLALAAGNFDAVITDFQLRWTTGLDILEILKQRYPDCPVVMFTNTGTEEIAVEAMKLGLDDYIIKDPNRYVRLPASLRAAIKRHKTQQRAALLDLRLKNLLNQVKIGIFRCDREGRLLEANPAFLEILGVESLAEANELNLLDLRDRYQQLVSLPSRQQQEQEVQLQRRDGTSFWALLTTTLNRIADTDVVDGLLDDISERKQSELALQRLNAQLAARVRDQTAQLAALTDLSQDLQSPLRTIQQCAQILLKLSDSLDPESLEALQSIAANAQHLDTQLSNLLASSRSHPTEIDLDG